MNLIVLFQSYVIFATFFFSELRRTVLTFKVVLIKLSTSTGNLPGELC